MKTPISASKRYVHQLLKPRKYPTTTHLRRLSVASDSTQPPSPEELTETAISQLKNTDNWTSDANLHQQLLSLPPQSLIKIARQLETSNGSWTVANVGKGTTEIAESTTVVTPNVAFDQLMKAGEQQDCTGPGQSQSVGPSQSQHVEIERLESLPSGGGGVMPVGRMRGSSKGDQLAATRERLLAPPRQPIRANEPWSRPTPTLPIALLMQQKATNSNTILNEVSENVRNVIISADGSLTVANVGKGTTEIAESTTVVTPNVAFDQLMKGFEQRDCTGPGQSQSVSLSQSQHVEIERPESLPSGGCGVMPVGRMRGSLKGDQLAVARERLLAPPRQPVRANEPWSRPTPTLAIALLMKQKATNSNTVNVPK
ncbi:hypothetical protein LXL04_027836 [Taraxacum kok-saghyz]